MSVFCLQTIFLIKNIINSFSEVLIKSESMQNSMGVSKPEVIIKLESMTNSMVWNNI